MKLAIKLLNWTRETIFEDGKILLVRENNGKFEQIKMCFRAYRAENWETEFD